MKCFCFLTLFTCIEFYAQFNNAEFDEYALTLVQDENKLKFPEIALKITMEFDGYLADYKDVFYLCPTEPKPALKITSTFTGQYYSPAKKICNEPVEPTILKVEGALDNVYLYHIGFLINDEKLKHIEKLTNYESTNENDNFMPMISVYQEKELQYITAVKYEISTVDLKKKINSSILYKSSDLFADKIQQFYQDQDSKLRIKLSDNYIADKHALVLDTLANENDFIVDTWKKTFYFKVFQILIWKENHETWKMIQKYVGDIFKTGISTKIRTAGIGNALTISYSEDRKYKMEWGQEKETLFIPELYWIAIEHKSLGSDKVTGMFVIMHNLPGAGEKNVEKVCDINICITNNMWFPTNKYEPLKQRVYCCPMDTATISRLKLTYLLTEKDVFDGRKYVSFPLKLE